MMSEKKIRKLSRTKGEEDRQTGSISKATYFKFFALGIGDLSLPLIFLFITSAQSLKIISENIGLKWYNCLHFNVCISVYARVETSFKSADFTRTFRVRLNRHEDYNTFVILSVSAILVYFFFSFFVGTCFFRINLVRFIL